eukprot:scaffold179054_cov19-Tisochrysis_lutea.AAC.1
MVRSTCGEGAAQLLTAEQCAVQCASCCYGVVEGVSGEGKSTYCDGWWDFTLCNKDEMRGSVWRAFMAEMPSRGMRGTGVLFGLQGLQG